MTLCTTMNLLLLLSIFFVSSCGTRTSLYSGKYQDDGAGLAFSFATGDRICESLVEPRGYACEKHTVTTKDGFILGLQRIGAGGSGGGKGTRPPVLLQHGILMDGALWVLGSAEKSLAYILADDGFDVWLANTRGTASSLHHASLSPADKAFWNWSWDELVAFDLPAMFQYVHSTTQQNLHYVAHSLGTLTALAALSNHQLVNMLRSAALISPIAYLKDVTSPVLRVGSDIVTANESYWLSVAKFDPLGAPTIRLFSEICNTPGVDCSNLNSFSGPNCCLDTSLCARFISYSLQSTSAKNIIHLSQMVEEGTIAMFDYNDKDENKKRYGQPTPPVYNMTKIPGDVPLFLSYGGFDAISDVKDVKHLLENLNNHAKDKLVVKFIKNYGHVDFVFGDNAKTVVYDPVMTFLKIH